MSQITSSKLCLEAMTLRGVGSYLHGARLDIRPFTILCGKNGSGKSTWFKTLNMLRNWNRDFPFPSSDNMGEGDDTDWTEFHLDHTNAFVKTVQSSNNSAEAHDSTREFGPPGCIGFHFRTVEELSLPRISSDLVDDLDNASLPLKFLWLGKCPKDTTFRLRIAHPSRLETAEDLNDEQRRHCTLHDQHIELLVNGQYALRFTQPAGDFDLFHRPYAFTADANFMSGSGQAKLTHAPIVDVTYEGKAKVKVQDGSAMHQLLCDTAIQRMRELFGLLEAAFFLFECRAISPSLSRHR